MELEALVALQGGEVLPLLPHTQVLTIQYSGSDNPSSQLIMAMFLLITHPTALRTLQAELDIIFSDPTEPLDGTALAIPYLDAVINETFRLSSPWLLPRVVPNSGVVIDGKVIPGGTILALASYSQHVSKENFFPDPMVSLLLPVYVLQLSTVSSAGSLFGLKDGLLVDLVPDPY
jgi:hypothetical protein